MRLATFNVESLFDRPKIMNLPKWTEGSKVLKDYARLNEIIGQEVYSATEKNELLEIMARYPRLSSLRTKDSTYIRLRDNRGDFLRKPQGKPVEMGASGRGSWIGWFELKIEPINEVATENTARIVTHSECGHSGDCGGGRPHRIEGVKRRRGEERRRTAVRTCDAH